MTKSHLRIFITALMTGIAIMLSPHAEAYAQVTQVDFETTDGSDIAIVRHQAVKMETTAPATPLPAPHTGCAARVIGLNIHAVPTPVVRTNLQKVYCVFRE